MKISDDSKVDTFCVKERTDEFQLEEHFSIKLEGASDQVCLALSEAAIWKEIYTNPVVYNLLGRVACVVLDVVYNMGGSEAIAESYYSVMNSQRFDGGQLNETLDMRTLVDWCLPPVLACPNSVSAIAKIYREGDDGKVNKHRCQLFHDKKGRAYNKYVTSKLLDKQVNVDRRLPFFS